jgi:hypothetical protein
MTIMSGTKQAPARLSAAEQARIEAALAAAEQISNVLARSSAAAARCSATLDGLDETVRDRLGAFPAQAEQDCRDLDTLRADLAADVQRIRDGLQRALATGRAGVPALDDRARQMADDLGARMRALDEQSDRIDRLAEQVAGDDAAAERGHARHRRTRLESTLQQLQSRLSHDPSFRWISPEAARVLDEGRRHLQGGVDDETCTRVEAELEALRRAAIEAERLHHERRRTVDLVRQVFHDHGFEVASATEPPHGRTDDIHTTFTPTEEHLLVTIGTRQPWERDDQGQQVLHLRMEAKSGSEQGTDPLCIERLRAFILRARELGFEIGDVLQPLPGGGYECVLSADSVVSEQDSRAASAGRAVGGGL